MRDEHRKLTTSWSEFTELLDQKFTLLAPFCGAVSCEEAIKKHSAIEENTDSTASVMGAKTLCIPLEQV